MNTSPFLLRSTAAAALLCAAGLSQAAIVGSTSTPSAFATLTAGSVDSFNELTINQPLGVTSLARSAGGVGYTVSTETALWTTQIAGIGGAGLTVDGNADTLSFGGFTAPVLAFGGQFFLTDAFDYGTAASSITILATDVNGLSQSFTYSQTASQTGAAVFFGIRSDVALASVRISPPAIGSNPNLFITADNLVLSAVPEPASWALALAGAAAVLGVARRRRGG